MITRNSIELSVNCTSLKTKKKTLEQQQQQSISKKFIRKSHSLKPHTLLQSSQYNNNYIIHIPQTHTPRSFSHS